MRPRLPIIRSQTGRDMAVTRDRMRSDINGLCHGRQMRYPLVVATDFQKPPPNVSEGPQSAQSHPGFHRPKPIPSRIRDFLECPRTADLAFWAILAYLAPMLPAYPWSQRPDDHPLSVEEVCAALVEAEGDIPAAASRLKVGTLILRKFIERSTRARAVIREMIELLNDEAQRTLRQAIRDPDARRQDWATRYVLNSQNAKARGYSPVANADEASTARGLNLTLTLPIPEWADGTRIGPPAAPQKQLIDVTPSVAQPAKPADE